MVTISYISFWFLRFFLMVFTYWSSINCKCISVNPVVFLRFAWMKASMDVPLFLFIVLFKWIGRVIQYQTLTKFKIFLGSYNWSQRMFLNYNLTHCNSGFFRFWIWIMIKVLILILIIFDVILDFCAYIIRKTITGTMSMTNVSLEA
jgi:hypothetical protein